MVQIAGKYEHVSNDGFPEYLKTIGTPPDSIKVFNHSKPIFEISEGGGKWTIKDQFRNIPIIIDAGKAAVSKFALGEPYDEPILNEILFKSITKRDGNKFIIETDMPEAKKAHRIYQFTDTGIITVHVSDKKSNKKATRTHTRI